MTTWTTLSWMNSYFYQLLLSLSIIFPCFSVSSILRKFNLSFHLLKLSFNFVLHSTDACFQKWLRAKASANLITSTKSMKREREKERKGATMMYLWSLRGPRIIRITFGRMLRVNVKKYMAFFHDGHANFALTILNAQWSWKSIQIYNNFQNN